MSVDDDQEGKSSVSVTSYDQRGGITAHTVNIDSRGRRVLSDELKDGLLNNLSKDKKITVLGLNGDTESCGFAREISDFLAENGYQATSSWHQFFDPPVFSVKISPFNGGAEWHIVVGPAQ